MVGSLTVSSLMSFLMPDCGINTQVKQDDPCLKSEYIRYLFSNGGETLKPLLLMPEAANAKPGGIVVVH